MCIHVCMHMYAYAFLCAYIYMCIYVSLYTEEYINYNLTYSHSKLTNFTIIMNKWTVLKLLQNFEFLLSKNVCTLITM
jgi:hypothetical protein